MKCIFLSFSLLLLLALLFGLSGFSPCRGSRRNEGLADSLGEAPPGPPRSCCPAFRPGGCGTPVAECRSDPVWRLRGAEPEETTVKLVEALQILIHFVNILHTSQQKKLLFVFYRGGWMAELNEGGNRGYHLAASSACRGPALMTRGQRVSQ